MDKDVVEINEEDTFAIEGGEDGVGHALQCVVGTDKPNDMRVNWNIPQLVQYAVVWQSNAGI